MAIRFPRFVVLVTLIGVAVRVAAALYLGDQVEDLPGTADQVSYHILALRVLDGHGFTFGEAWWPLTAADAPTAHWSYLYTFYLVAVYSIFGPDPVTARLIQAVLVGLIQPYLAYLIGRRVFNEKTGLVAAAITAAYTYFIYYAANLMTEAFYITAIMVSLYLATRIVSQRREQDNIKLEGPNLKLTIYLGLALGVAILLRQAYLLFLPFLFLWMGWAYRRMAIKAVLLVCVIVAILILPFTIYNYTRFERFVLLNTNAGFAYYWGNHPIYGTRFIPILPSRMGDYSDLIPRELRHLDEAALDQALLKRGIQFVVDDPLRYVLLSISRIPAYFVFWPSHFSGTLSNVARMSSFGLFWPLMLYGLIRSVVDRKETLLKPPSYLLMLYLFMAVYTGIHLLTWALIRYRLPVDAVLIIFAGFAIAALSDRIPVLRRLVELAAF